MRSIHGIWLSVLMVSTHGTSLIQAQTKSTGQEKEINSEFATELPDSVIEGWTKKKVNSFDAKWIGLNIDFSFALMSKSKREELRDSVPVIDLYNVTDLDLTKVPIPKTQFGLKNVKIETNKVADLKRFPTLVHLSLSLPDEATNCPGLGNLSSLRCLEITAQEATDKLFSDEVVKLKKLSHLDLSSGKYTDTTFASLSKLEKLESFGFSSVVFSSERMALIGKLTKLKTLRLEAMASLGLNGISAKAFAEVAKLKDLENLRLNDIAIEPDHLDTIASLPNLRYLEIIKGKIPDEAAQKLHGIKTLKVLTAYENITPSAADKLKKAIPGLIVK